MVPSPLHIYLSALKTSINFVIVVAIFIVAFISSSISSSLLLFLLLCYYVQYNLFTTLREERRLRVFENRVVRRVFGPKRDEVTGECRKLQNEELSDLYSLPNVARVVNREE